MIEKYIQNRLGEVEKFICYLGDGVRFFRSLGDSHDDTLQYIKNLSITLLQTYNEITCLA